MSPPVETFEVRYLDMRTNRLGQVYGVRTPSDTVLALDRHAIVSAVGTGTLTIESARLVLAGRRTVRSGAALAAGGTMAILVGFLVAMMWQAERWPPLGLAILGVLVLGCVLLFTRARRIEPFQWAIPWPDVPSFTEMDDPELQWLVTVKGTHVGTLGFSVLGGRGEALVDALVRIQESGLAKVTFRERDVPAAEVLR